MVRDTVMVLIGVIIGSIQRVGETHEHLVTVIESTAVSIPHSRGRECHRGLVEIGESVPVRISATLEALMVEARDARTAGTLVSIGAAAIVAKAV